MKWWCQRMQLWCWCWCFFCPANTVSFHLSSVKDGHFMVGWFSSELVVHSLTSLESFTPSCLYQGSALVSATFHDCEIDLPHHLSGPFLEMKSFGGPVWSSALALAPHVRGCLIRHMNTEDWRHLFSCRSQFRMYSSAKFDVLSSVYISMKHGGARQFGVGKNREEHPIQESVVWNQSF